MFICSSPLAIYSVVNVNVNLESIPSSCGTKEFLICLLNNVLGYIRNVTPRRWIIIEPFFIYACFGRGIPSIIYSIIKSIVRLIQF